VRVLVIVLIVLGIAFAGVVIFGMARDRDGARQPTQMSNGAPPTDEDGDVDEDALEEWDPPSASEAMAKLFSPFAPRIKLDPPAFDVGDNALSPTRRGVPRDRGAGKDDMRIARIRWVSGAPVLATHDCSRDEGCPEKICLCPGGATYDEDRFDGCPEGWIRRRRASDDKLRCRAGDEAGSLVIYREGGSIEFLGLDGTSRVAVE